VFRILNQRPVYLDNAGRPLELGVLRFYDAGTTTPRDVYSEPDGSVNIGSSVALGVDGRTVEDVWGDGAYYIRIEAEDGTLIDEADNVEIPGGAGSSIPTAVDGQFLTSAGGVLLWAPIIEVPDPTGQGGKQLGTDGANVFWEPKPAPPVIPPSDIVNTPGKFIAGTHFEQWGTSSCPATGGDHASVAVAFPEAFDELYGVTLNVKSGVVNGICMVATGTTNETNSGFTAEFDIADRHFYNSHITSPIPFFWRAIGKKNAAP
jgi:hypothetical protein